MNETNLIIQNRLREATVSLERANLIICDETWKCDSSVPPFSSIQLVLQGEGTVCIDETTIHPTGGQLYLLPAYTNQAFFTDIQNPYRTYYCHFEITCQQTDLFKLIHLPLCIDAKDPEKAEQLFLDLVHSVPLFCAESQTGCFKPALLLSGMLSARQCFPCRPEL